MSRERESAEEIGKKIKRESDVFSGTSHQLAAGSRGQYIMPSSGGSGGAAGLNTITPCAACKLLRRRCAQECPFSPYFSPLEPHKFASVHRVFGASNVSKMLMEVPESQRADTANSLVYEANVRLRDPVYGCMGAISTLQQQVQSLQEELNAVRAEILHYKFRETAAASSSSNINDIHNSNLAALHLPSGIAVSIAALLPPPTPPPPPPQQVLLLPPPPSVLPRTPSSSSMYSPPPASSTATDFSTISNDNISFFG